MQEEGYVINKSNIIIIGQVATLLGLLMNAIFSFTDGCFGISNIGMYYFVLHLVIYAPALPNSRSNSRSFKRCLRDHES